MTKKELAAKVAESANLTLKQANAAVDAVLTGITDAVAAGDKVSLAGFGTFEKKHRDARTGRNPHTGEAVEIPAADVPGFKAGKAFKDKVNG